MKVIIVGVPGTGKTSVAKGLVDEGWDIVTFGTVLFEIAKEKYGVEDRDQMRSAIPSDDYGPLQQEAARRIGAMEGKVLVDTHCSILKPEGYYPGLPARVLDAIEPDAFVVVEADPADIAKRRAKDAGERNREGDPAEHQLVNRWYAVAYSALSGAPVAFLDNEQGKLKETQRKLREIVKRVG